MEEQLTTSALLRRAPKAARFDVGEVKRRITATGVEPFADPAMLLPALNRIRPDARAAERIPIDLKASLAALKHDLRRIHGSRFSLAWFPWWTLRSPCADRFGYLTPPAVRAASRLPFDAVSQQLLATLGDLMGDGSAPGDGDAALPAGYTYVGQFVDHDITFDVSSPLDALTDANTVNNMRSPAIELDSLYGPGPALAPFMYVFPSAGPTSAIKLAVGRNTPTGRGGPSGPTGAPSAMVQKTDFDVPRAATQTAIIGDPRNDENLIVSQFHHAMIRFHNRVVDMLVLAGFGGDIFVEAKRMVTHHYQWAVVHDFLRRVCGPAAVTAALANVSAPIGSPFRMPVEFSVAAYRFGHSMIRDNYWVNHNFTNATLAQVFEFARVPQLPVFSNWVVDFNAFFPTGFPVPVNNRARRIDTIIARGLEALPGFVDMMAVLARRNLQRGLALGLPSGQATARFMGVPVLTAQEITDGLPTKERDALVAGDGRLLRKTPLWYYVLREAAVKRSGETLGPLGAKIVAETLVRILKRDGTSFLNVSGGFTPALPSATAGQFTFADLLHFAGVLRP